MWLMAVTVWWLFGDVRDAGDVVTWWLWLFGDVGDVSDVGDAGDVGVV